MHRWIVRLAVVGGAALTLGTLPASSSYAVRAPALPHVMLTRSERAGVQPPPVSLGIETPSLGGLPFPGNMAYFGGPVMRNPKVYLIFWGFDGTNDPSGVQGLLTNFFSGIGGSSYFNVVTQYSDTTGPISNPSGQLAGTWVDTASPIHDNLSSADYAAEASWAVAHFNGGTPDPSANYFVATPKNYNDSGFNSGSYCAYHDYTTPASYPGLTQGISFTVMPYIPNAGSNCGAGLVNTPGANDGVTMVGGHEYLESVTDPETGANAGGWYDTVGNENADKCAYVTVGPGSVTNVTFPTGTFPVQGTWSNNGLAGLGSCATAG